MLPSYIFLILVLSAGIIPVMAEETLFQAPGFAPSYVHDTIPNQLLPGKSYPVMLTFRNTGLVSWEDEMRRIGLLYEGDMTKVTAIPSFVEVPRGLNITPGREAYFGLTLLPVGVPGTYDLAFVVVMRSAVSDQQITERFVKRVTIVPTDGISSPVNGSVYIESIAHDHEVYLNYILKGNVPAIISDVKPGSYTLTVRNTSFERSYQIEVEPGTMTRVFVRRDDSPPLIEKKVVNPVSSGSLLGYIEANIPLILIILLIVGVCIAIATRGLRTRRTHEDEWDKEQKKQEEPEDPGKEREKQEKEMLDKIHLKKPVFEGLDPASDPAGSGRIQLMRPDKPPGGKRSKGGVTSRTQDKIPGAAKGGRSTAGGGGQPSGPDIILHVQDLEAKPGSAVASIGVSNRSDASVTVEGQVVGGGGFGIVPVQLEEPVNDEPEMILGLRIFAGGAEFLRSISVPYNRGVALLARGVVGKAYEYFRSLFHTHPDQIDALYQQAQILLGWGLEDEAEGVLKEILEVDPGNLPAHEALDSIQEAKERRKETREHEMRPAIPDYPDELSDRYTAIRILGDDPFATVILVLKNDTGDLRALKIPKSMESIGSSLYTEISLLYQLRHPYVLRMFRAEFSPTVFLELEYVAGGYYLGRQCTGLADLPVPIPEEDWLPLIEKIGEGLAYLHRQGVRHYHLSPTYILLDEPMVPKISGLIRESLRGTGIGGGEEFFVRAPEQIDPQFFGKPGKRTDIYQFGAIWLWLATGKVISWEESDDTATGTKTLLQQYDPSLSRYDPLLEKLIARFKADRYSSLEIFLSDLTAIHDDEDNKKN